MSTACAGTGIPSPFILSPPHPPATGLAAAADPTAHGHGATAARQSKWGEAGRVKEGRMGREGMGWGSGGDAAAATPATAFPSTPSILSPASPFASPLRGCVPFPAAAVHHPPGVVTMPPPIVTTPGATLLTGGSVLRWRRRASAVVYRADGAAGGWAIHGHVRFARRMVPPPHHRLARPPSPSAAPPPFIFLCIIN